MNIVSRKRGLILGAGIFVLVLVGFLLISQLVNTTKSVVVPTVPSIATPSTPSQNSEGQDVYVISQGVNQAVGSSSGGVLDRFLDGHESSVKMSMFFKIGMIALIAFVFFGKGFLKMYEHKRYTYDVIKDDIDKVQDNILKMEALLSRTKDAERLKMYEHQLQMSNDRMLKLLILQEKNDKKFLR